jgi:lysophospholipase L1-like esterase
MKRIFLIFGLLGLVGWLPPKKRVVFFGDSITEAAVRPNGYLDVLKKELDKNGKGGDYELVGAGISGNKVPDLQARLERDVLSRNPDVVVIYIGINDVWHFAQPNNSGTPKAKFEAGLTDIISQLKAKNIRVILCTPSVIGEAAAGTNAQDKMLDDYAAVSRKVAQATGAELCDLRAAFQRYLGKYNKSNMDKNVLTTDGVHLNNTGNQLVARQMLTFL